MTESATIRIDALVLPGIDAHGVQQIAEALHAHLGEMELADQAQGRAWRQPDGPIDLSLDAGSGGIVDTRAMAAAIRAHFVDQAGHP